MFLETTSFKFFPIHFCPKSRTCPQNQECVILKYLSATNWHFPSPVPSLGQVMYPSWSILCIHIRSLITLSLWFLPAGTHSDNSCMSSGSRICLCYGDHLIIKSTSIHCSAKDRLICFLTILNWSLSTVHNKQQSSRPQLLEHILNNLIYLKLYLAAFQS